MSILHNRINNEELRQKMLAETTPRSTVSFYRYFHCDDPQAFRDALYQKLFALKVFGRIYVAAEGINGQISVPQDRFDAFRDELYSFAPLTGIRLNTAVDDDGKSFWVLRIKVRPKIVADGIDDPSFDPSDMGTHLKAAEFNALAADPDTIIVDMRNHYEYEVGHFDHALEVPSQTFREQLPMAADMLADQRGKNIVMYCTGGIRCEKASAYLKHKGFPNVFQLEGGIIEYTRRAREQGLPLLFKGKNFVFDERMGERITADVLAHCHVCGAPADVHINCANDICHRLFIPCDDCREQLESCCSAQCVSELHLPEEDRKALLAERLARGEKPFTKRRGA